MPSVSLGFKVHIPYRLKKFLPAELGVPGNWFDGQACKAAVDKLSDECYVPANKIIYSLIKKYGSGFRIAFSFSGTAIELLQIHRPDVLQTFRDLANTGCIDIYAETYYHSLSWLYSKTEFLRQIKKHDDLIKMVFGIAPSVFCNTDLIYHNELARSVSEAGYKGILCDGSEKFLKGRHPNQAYASPGNGDFRLLLRNVRLSDDIAFRFDDATWNEQPLTAEKYAGWLHTVGDDAGVVNLFFDYETFGIHKKHSSGIFDFLEHLPPALLAKGNGKFVTPSEAIEICYPKDIYDVAETISWANKDMMKSVSSENMMQNNTLRKIYSLEKSALSSSMPGAAEWWGSLQSADHFYYMCNDDRTQNDSYRSLNPFQSAEEAFENYKYAVADFEIRLIRHGLNEIKNKGAEKKRTKVFSTMIY